MCLQRPPCFGIFRFAVGWIFATKTKSVWSSGLRGKKEKLTMLGVKIWPPTCSEFLVFLTDLVRQTLQVALSSLYYGNRFLVLLSTYLWIASATTPLLPYSLSKERELIPSIPSTMIKRYFLKTQRQNTISHYLFANPGSFSEQLTLGSL